MPVMRNTLNSARLNAQAQLPFELRIEDFRLAMQVDYDFFDDVDTGLVEKGLDRLDEMLRPAIMSGLLSDMLTASPAKRSRRRARQVGRAPMAPMEPASSPGP